MRKALQQKIDQKTKPTGSLGMLEDLAVKIGEIQQTLTPALHNPALIVFAGDHGIAQHGVSAYPQEVTHQMVLNFLHEGAAINVLCKQHAIDLHVVDAGVNVDFEPDQRLINNKINYGTKSFLSEAAMTADEYEQGIQKGRELVQQLASKGTNVIGFGEMGIGNTSSSAVIMSYLCDAPIEDCVGRGTGVTGEHLDKKIELLQTAKNYHGSLTSTEDILATFAGFEMVHMCGAMLEAYEQGMIILVDGFIASTVFMAAHTLNTSIIDHAIFCHLSDEKGHALLLRTLNVTPILNLGLRLGEGTGCALAYPILQSAVAILNDMASFEDAGVSTKS